MVRPAFRFAASSAVADGLQTKKSEQFRLKDRLAIRFKLKLL
jgi:hypothetical protein